MDLPARTEILDCPGHKDQWVAVDAMARMADKDLPGPRDHLVHLDPQVSPCTPLLSPDGSEHPAIKETTCMVMRIPQ